MRPLCLFLFLLGCAKNTGSYEVAAAAATSAAPDQKSALQAEAEALWNERGDKAKLQGALQKYEQLYALDPTDRGVAYHLVRGWYFLGDGHETEKEARLSTWATAIDWGKKCLAINTEFKGLLEKGDEDEASAARALTAADVPCLYWTSSALGKWGKNSGIATTLKHLPTVKAWMSRVGELEPSYYFNGPDRYWGAYYSAIPSFAGQDLDKSKAYFDKALAAHPNFFGTHVLYAEELLSRRQDKAGFVKELEWVLSQPADLIPEVRPEAEAEQRKARALLDAIGDKFAD